MTTLQLFCVLVVCHIKVLCYFHPRSLIIVTIQHFTFSFRHLFHCITTFTYDFSNKTFYQILVKHVFEVWILMCLWLVWNDLIWSNCRLAINLVMQCTILYQRSMFNIFKPWNQILWNLLRLLLCGAAILDIVCIIGALFYAYSNRW